MDMEILIRLVEIGIIVIGIGLSVKYIMSSIKHYIKEKSKNNG